MKKRSCAGLLLLMAMLVGIPMALAAEPGVNEAIVVINGETITMKAVSMEVKTIHSIVNQTIANNSSSIGEYVPASVYGANKRFFQLEVINFNQIDTRTGQKVGALALAIPSNWEKGSRYSSEDDLDSVFGKVAIEYQNLQRNKTLTLDVILGITTGSMELIVDDANANYTMIKGRFVAELTYFKDDPVTFDLSSFYVDKSLLGKPDEPFDDPFVDVFDITPPPTDDTPSDDIFPPLQVPDILSPGSP